MVKLKSKFEFIILFFCTVFCFSCLAGCKKYYWNYCCSWVSDEPEIELYQGCGSGRMTVDGTGYEFYTAQSNNATYIIFYDKDDNVILNADTELKNEKLYLTVKIDNIFGLEGKTIILSQKEA